MMLPSSLLEPPAAERSVILNVARLAAGPEGRDFEARVAEGMYHPKLAFMASDHPYHPYYQFHKAAMIRARAAGAAAAKAIAKPEPQQGLRPSRKAVDQGTFCH